MAMVQRRHSLIHNTYTGDMPPEEVIMALIDVWLVQDYAAARHRFALYGLPVDTLETLLYHYSKNFEEYHALPQNCYYNKTREEQHIVAHILARKGSKGLPGKALRTLGGVPLIVIAIKKALSIRHVKRVLVNTDCPEIAEIARNAGAETPFLRPAELATDKALSSCAATFGILWLIVVEKYYTDFHIVVSATHPFFEVEEINNALDAMLTNNGITLECAAELPFFNPEYYIKNSKGTLEPFPLTFLPKGKALYAQCGAFSITNMLEAVKKATGKEISKHHALVWPLPTSQCHDIDTECDFALAENIINGCSTDGDDHFVQHQCNRTESFCTLTQGYPLHLHIVLLPYTDVSESLAQRYMEHALHFVRAVNGKDIFFIGTNEKLIKWALQNKFQVLYMERPAFVDNTFLQRIIQYIRANGNNAPLFVTDAQSITGDSVPLHSFLQLVACNPNSCHFSVSSPPVHAALLKYVDTDGLLPVCTLPSARRQDLPPLWVRDGILTWIPANFFGLQKGLASVENL